MEEIASTTIARDSSLVEVWDRNLPYPHFEEMEDLDCVTHVMVERARKGGYHYLHETALAQHKDKLFMVWANHPICEMNATDELIRGTVSHDGGVTWEKPKICLEEHFDGYTGFNHPCLSCHDDTVWGFFTGWRDGKPDVLVFRLDESSGNWQNTGGVIPGFIPFSPPLKMNDGNWIMGGELFWYESAVAISKGDDFTSWQVVQLPKEENLELQFPETAIMLQGDRLMAFCRPKGRISGAPVSFSHDSGRTWLPLTLSNFPLSRAQPLIGRLSTGQHFLLTNHLEEDRALLTISVTRPDETLFSRIRKLRHQAFPRRRLFGGGHGGPCMIGYPTEWSYPSAVEHNGNLIISYTHGKEDCACSIVPLRALRWE